jgi:hypothetical protein
LGAAVRSLWQEEDMEEMTLSLPSAAKGEEKSQQLAWQPEAMYIDVIIYLV